MGVSAWEEAQRSVIGSLAIDGDHVAGEVFQTAKPGHFGDQALRHLFEATRSLWNDNRPIDAVTILDAAGKDYHDLLRTCMIQTPTSANISAWLEICRSSARLDAMKAEALAIINAESESEAVEAYERMGTQLQDAGRIERMTLGQLIEQYLDRMQDKTPVSYLNWGFEKLDRALYVSAGQFGVIAADSSSGKTALTLQFAYHQAAGGKRVGFISLETPWESLGDRLMAEKQLCGIPLSAAHQKNLTEDHFRRAGSAGIRSDGVSLTLYRNCFTLQEIRSVILQDRLDVVYIDYVQLIDAPGKERWDIVTHISMGLHRMAQQLGTIIIGLSQITPAVKGSKQAPTKDDLRESRQLKQDADFIMLLYPDTEDGADANGRVLELAKNKDGRLIRSRLNFEPDYMTFTYRAPSVNEMRGQGKTLKGMRHANAAGAGAASEQASFVVLQNDTEDLPF